MDLEDAGGNAAERHEQLPHGVGVAGTTQPRKINALFILRSKSKIIPQKRREFEDEVWLHRAQDAVSREEIKRLRQKQRETGMSECDYFLEECCCGASRAGAGASSCCPSFLVRCCRCGAGAEAEAANGGGGGNGDADESNGGRDDCAFVQGSRQI